METLINTAIGMINPSSLASMVSLVFMVTGVSVMITLLSIPFIFLSIADRISPRRWTIIDKFTDIHKKAVQLTNNDIKQGVMIGSEPNRIQDSVNKYIMYMMDLSNSGKKK